MARRTKAILGILAFATVCGVAWVLWRQGVFSPSPEAVIRDTLEKANRGDYAGAVANLTENMRRSWWNTDIDVRNATLDAVTRRGEFRDIEIYKVEDLGGTVAVEYWILYKEGHSPKILEFCIFESGRWRPILTGTIKVAAPDFNAWDPKDGRILPLAVAASKARLQDPYSIVPGTKVKIRLPGNCRWDEKRGEYADSELHFLLAPVERSNQGLKSRLEFARSAWDGNSRSLAEEKQIDVAGRKATLFVGEFTDAKGDKWHNLLLVFGTDSQSVMIEGQAPRVDRLRQLLEASMLTAKWER